jgi:hypothetical protein
MTADLARLRGEMAAIEQVSIRTRCNIQFQHQSPPAAGNQTWQMRANGRFVKIACQLLTSEAPGNRTGDRKTTANG